MGEISLKFSELKLPNYDPEKTITGVVFLRGGGNMFGGSAEYAVVTIHGKYSILETKSITVKGVITTNYNIARGANGGDSDNLSYYEGLKTLDNWNVGPTFTVAVKGRNGGAIDSAVSLLGAEKIWKK